MRIGFPGERGAYAEAAAAALFNFDIATRPMKSYVEICDGIDSGEISLGILPLENNYAGSFHEVYDLIRERDIFITNEAQIKTSYALAGSHNADEKTIKRIYAHPLALAQCEDYLRSLKGVDLIPRYDSEQSDQDLVKRQSKEEATLCSRHAAAMYGFKILRKNCNSMPDSTTRYIAVAKEPRKPKPEEGKPQTMVLFEMQHEPGTLMRCLGAFADAGINLHALVTRPTRAGDWDFTTFVTFEGAYDDPKTMDALSRLDPHTSYKRHVGSFVLKDIV